MKNQITSLPETGYVRLPTILILIPVSKATWWKGVKSGRFPKPVKLGARISVWKAQEIRSLIEQMESDSKEGG